ncbi:Ig-like domain-containing protein [Roseibium sp. HPY-6]|uniref:Ig-like domain-containing protein n=1 Tax=Roseibium sp. HPY-6 TaxID=3229852 RepID=UPI00338D924B
MARLISRVQNGVLVGDQRLDQLLLLQDLDGDGAASSAGETTVFFDETNASGLTLPTNNVFTVHQSRDKSVYIGDGTADAVFKLNDLNNDGDAQDAGEAKVWFSAENAAGFSTITPNGIYEGGDGAIYVTNAGTSSTPQDAIYRTVDLNGDGDANDEGEATLWLDVQTVIDTAVPFDISFDGDVAYLNDLTGAATDAIYRIEDKNGDGTIQDDEVTTFISDDMNFGAPVDIANATSVDGSLYTLTWFPEFGEELKLYRLTDLDGSGQIDDQSEAVEVWNASAMPEGFGAEIGFSVAADEDGNLSLTANTFRAANNVVRLSDLNGDGDYLDEGETSVFGSSDFDGQLNRPRAVEFYEGKAEVTVATAGAGNHFSVFLDTEKNTLYTSGENVVGQLGIGTTGFDVKSPVEVAMPEGFDSKIVSVSAGLLHTTFLTEDGDVYAFGFNNRGPLGTGDEETRTTATLVEDLDDVNIVIIENGNGVSYAISDTGTLYAWGTNSNGQLGLGDQEERLEPTVVEALSNETVVLVSSGTAFTLALTADGQVWAFGSNTDGQLGSPDALEDDGTPARRSVEPVLVEGLPGNIISVTADTKTSYAVTADGRVFGWGESRYGQLLQGTDNGDGTFTADTADVLSPIELDGLPGNVVEVKGGARWGAALTEDGDVYVWGPNDEGPSGGLDGDPGLESDAFFYPTLIPQLDDVNIVELHTGPNSLIAVADDGSIFTWGSNSDGRLGFSSDGSVYFPVEISLTGDADPFLVSASPADNERDVPNDSALVLEFTEEVEAGSGFITLVNRDTGERTPVDVTDERLVQFNGKDVLVTPSEHLKADDRYYVEITEGAFVDFDGNPFEGISEGDTSTFNFTTADDPAPSEPVAGTEQDELLRGGADDDDISGEGGDDIVSGGLGNDTLNGGEGDDDLLGGEGDDRLQDGSGINLLDGGEGNDAADYSLQSSAVYVRMDQGWVTDLANKSLGWAALTQGIAANTIEHDDLVNIENIIGSAFGDQIVGDAGNNEVRAGDGNDYVAGLGGDDDLFGEEGDDRLIGGSGSNLLDGGEGTDTADYSQEAEGIYVRLDQSWETSLGNKSLGWTALTTGIASGTIEHDDLVSIESIVGSNSADIIVGNGASNSIFGRDGNDLLSGLGGNDTLLGENGNDKLFGGVGNDRLDGGAGNDLLVGGAGFDIFVFTSGNDVVQDFDPSVGEEVSGADGDLISISFAGIFDFDDVLATASQEGSDTVFTLSETDSLTLQNTLLVTLENDDFQFI